MSEDKKDIPVAGSGSKAESIEDLAAEIQANFQILCDDRRPFITSALKGEKFYRGEQWTQDEKDVLAAKGQPDYIDNRLFPAVQSVINNVVGKSPSFLFSSKTNSDVTAMNTVLHHIFYISKFKNVIKRVVKSALTKGAGFCIVNKDTNSNDGLGDVKIKFVNIRDVYIPRGCKNIDFSDADRVIYSKLVTVDKFEQLYGIEAEDDMLSSYDEGYMDEVDTHSDENTTSETEGISFDRSEPYKQYVRIIIEFTPRKKEFINLFDATNGEKKIVGVDYELNENEQQLAAIGVLIPRTFEKTIWHRRDVVGSRVLMENDLNTSGCPLKRLVYEDTESPYSYSLIHFLEGMQKLVNKSHSIVLYNALLGSNPGYIGAQGIFGTDEKEIEKWTSNISIPGGNAEFYPTMPGEEPKPKAVLPLSNAFYSILQDARHEIEYLSAQFGIGRGDTQNAPETWRATYSIYEWGLNQLSEFFDALNDFFTDIGNTCKDYMSEVYIYPMRISVPDEDGHEANINFAVKDEQGNYSIENDIFGMADNSDIVVKPGSSAPTYKNILLLILSELASSGAPVQDLIVENLDLPDKQKKEVIQRIKSASNVQEMQKALEEKDKDIEQLFDKVIELEKDIELEKTKAKLAVLEEKKKQEVKLAVEKSKNKGEKND